MATEDYVEPWVRGPMPGVHPLLAPVLRSFEQAREDLKKWAGRLTEEQLWARPHGLAPAGFQIRHIAGSVQRLMTYATGGQLSAEQLAELRAEPDRRGSPAELFRELEEALEKAGKTIRSIDPRTLEEPRAIGRKELPATLGGLLIHIAEHTQRHVGQAIVTAKLAAQSQ